MRRHAVRAGFIPLLDACVLIVAHEKGFDKEQGIELELQRETSWANIRDRMSVGHFDVAHMLAPLPVAASIGLLPMPTNICAPFALGLGGNAVTISNQLANELHDTGFWEGVDPLANGRALEAVLRAKGTARRPVLAVVHPYSGHNYELRYWLAACGIDPDLDVEIVFVPPSMMPDALRSEHIDGFCVGEPWNTVAVDAGLGHVLTVKSKIWRSSPEKVLGVRNQFEADQPQTVAALIRALYGAAQWCGERENASELSEILSRPVYLDLPKEVFLPALEGSFKDLSGKAHKVDDFFLPFARAATFPWRSHALWFYTQMVRWGHTVYSEEHATKVQAVYRSDLYRAALQSLDADLPSASLKVEGALRTSSAVGSSRSKLFLGPDGFFDGAIFDPDKINDYVRAQSD